MKTRTLYDVLQVAPNAAQPIVDAAYEHLRTHCDLNGDPATGRLVDDAYATLRNPARRQDYDARLAQLAREREAQHTPFQPVRRVRLCRLMMLGWAVAAAAIGYGTATVWHSQPSVQAGIALDATSTVIARPANEFAPQREH